MKKNDIIRIADEHNGYLFSTILKKYAIDTIYISRLVKAGKLNKVARGVYITEKGVEDFYYITSIVYSKVVFSGESALFLNNLSNKQFVNNEVTIPYGSKVPKINSCKVVTLRANFEIGIIEIETPFGNIVKSYDKERCICDLFTRMHYYDYEDRIYAIHQYKNNYLNIKKLYEYAKILNVYDKIRNVFEVIGWN